MLPVLPLRELARRCASCLRARRSNEKTPAQHCCTPRRDIFGILRYALGVLRRGVARCWACAAASTSRAPLAVRVSLSRAAAARSAFADGCAAFAQRAVRGVRRTHAAAAPAAVQRRCTRRRDTLHSTLTRSLPHARLLQARLPTRAAVHASSHNKVHPERCRTLWRRGCARRRLTLFICALAAAHARQARCQARWTALMRWRGCNGRTTAATTQAWCRS